MLRTLGDILVSPVLCTTFPSTLKHPQMNIFSMQKETSITEIPGAFRMLSKLDFAASEVVALLLST